MIVDVYKILTENATGNPQIYNFFVENNSCQTRITDLALNWLIDTGQRASLNEPAFRYHYSELATDDIRTQVNQHGFAILPADESPLISNDEELQMHRISSLSEAQ
ncbi:MAG: hypothetical protein ACFHVJ_05805 [Aestuariibacter sp.]